jgi:hypothetical protein
MLSCAKGVSPSPRVASPRTTIVLRAAGPPAGDHGGLGGSRARTDTRAAQHGTPEPAPHLPASLCGVSQSVVVT